MNLTSYYQLFRCSVLVLLLWGSIILPASANDETPFQERPLVEILKDFSERYEVLFSYDSKSLETIRVDFEFSATENLESAIKRLLSPINFGYESFGDKYYVIYEKSESGKKSFKKISKYIDKIQKLEQGGNLSLQPQKVSAVNQLKSVASSAIKLRIEISVNGTITNEAGEPLAGATVIAKDTRQGTLTDDAGRFQLTVPETVTTLVISYIGYTTQEVQIAGRNTIDVVMAESGSSLDEVVLVGYGSARKKDLTGAVARVDLEKTRLQPNANPVQSLRGTVAGVTVIDNGRPGSDASILIRGRNSISANNNPLIVLDGIIYAGGRLSDINPNDIESIDILKDASSSAIFGSQAANGVILITTKKGTTTKPTISLNSYYGLSDYAHTPDYLDAEQYLAVRKDAELADNGPLPFQALEEANIAAGISIDPFEAIKRRAPISSNELSVSGRTEKVTYYYSGSYTTAKSPVQGDNFSRVAGRINLEMNITDWLKIGTNSGYNVNDLSGNRASLLHATYLSPYGNLYYDDGVPRPLPMDIGLVNNPLSSTLLNENLNISKTLFTNTYTEIQLPISGLSYRLNLGYTQRNEKLYNYRPSFNREQFFNLGSGSKYNYESQNVTLENIVRYDKVFGLHHAFNATFLYGSYIFKDESSSLSSNNIFNDALGYNALEIGENFAISTGAGESQQVSTMGRLGYRYKGKYIVDFTVRRDGYSAFGPGRKYGVFPAVGLSWNISEEDFLADIEQINNLKIRASWGKNGNQGVSRYSSLSNVSQTYYVFGDNNAPSVGLYSSSLGNPNLGWETTTSANIGADIAVFSSRIMASVEYYQSHTKDLLLTQRIPNTSGFETFLRNIGETENRGLELSLTTVNIQKNDFRWSTSVAFSLNRNKIVKLTGNDLNEDGVEDDDIASNWFIGYPLGSNFDYVFDGIFQDGDDLSLIPGAKPGHVKFKDLNEDGLITPADRTIVNTSQANFLAGITNSFSYRGFSLMILFNMRQGGFSPNSSINPGTNFYDLANVLDVPYWTPENPINTNAAINYRNPLGYRFYQSTSFIRLQDVSLSYDLPDAFLNPLKMKSVRIYISGKNLMTWTEWNGWDPEFGVGGRDPGNNGPLMKSVTAGLNIQL
ncbi:MAG: SusC/RagA family TonB-linked outer membrane protein [Bacteroidia bacterium]